MGLACGWHDSPWEAEQGWQVAGKVVHFGAAVTAQQLSPVEAHSTEILILYWYWGSLLGSRGSRNEPVFFRRCTLHFWWPLPSQRCDSDLSTPQVWGLDGIRQVVLADLGEEVSLSSQGTAPSCGGRERKDDKPWAPTHSRTPRQPSPRNTRTAHA